MSNMQKEKKAKTQKKYTKYADCIVRDRIFEFGSYQELGA